MLYLEDYVEMIEHLPQELRDRFTEMREMDLGVQNSMDNLEKRVKLFFYQAKKMKPTDKEAEYESIRKEYYKTLEDADEKVNLANQMYELVNRYLRRLDEECHKFKMELEADNKGITDILEKRSLELDQPSNSNQKENRYSSFNTSSRSSRDNYTSRDSSHSSRAEKRRDSNTSISSVEKRLAVDRINTASATIPEIRPPTLSGSVQPPGMGLTNSTSSPAISANQISSVSALSNSVVPVNYNLGHISAGGNAIVAAASQAIAATQHMQQGRRTASLKASYEAINTAGGIHASEISRELAGAAQTAIAAIQESNKKNKNKKVTTTPLPSTSVVPSAGQISQQRPVTPPVVQATAAAVAEVTDSEWTYDPNEPRYCVCNQVSYGDMVACDNSDCPFEWFHYPCVGITAPPKGKWFCPQCTSSMKRRGSRKT